MPAKVRNALTLYHTLREVPNIEIRLHRTTLYNSIYRAGDQLLVNQHAYGVHASHAPLFCLNGAEHGDLAAAVRARHACRFRAARDALVEPAVRAHISHVCALRACAVGIRS